MSRSRPLRSLSHGVRLSALALGAVLAAIPLLGACTELSSAADEVDKLGSAGSSPIPVDIGGVDVDVKVDVRALLRVLFPSLSPAEVERYARNFSAETILALQKELESARKAAKAFSEELFTTSEERVKRRNEALGAQGAFPVEVGAAALGAFDDGTDVRVELSGVFDGNKPVGLAGTQVTLSSGGKLVVGSQLDCLRQGEPVDLVFLVDVTGSMGSVIGSVRRSIVRFVNAIQSSGLQGTLSVVAYQDSVGVDVEFTEPAPAQGFERSPFFEPVSIADAAAVEELTRFVSRLEANRGADSPENLTGAIDFAANSVIGNVGGEPNVIGDAVADPAGTRAFPKLKNPRQVFVAFTDVGFHADSRTDRNSSLLPEFKPRPIAEVTRSLQQRGIVVHVVDPSYADTSLTPTGAANEVQVDSDYWARATGGVGEDTVKGFSLLDLELVSTAADTALLDVALDGLLASSCRITAPRAQISGELTVRIELAGKTPFEQLVPVMAITQ